MLTKKGISSGEEAASLREEEAASLREGKRLRIVKDPYASANTLPSLRVICSFVYSQWKSCCNRPR